jgi:hypothetical protein
MSHSQVNIAMTKEGDKNFYQDLEKESQKLRNLAEEMSKLLLIIESKEQKFNLLKNAFIEIAKCDIHKLDEAFINLQTILYSMDLGSNKAKNLWKSLTEEEITDFWEKFNLFNQEAAAIVKIAISHH